MNVETSKKILKIAGILSIIGGVLSTILGILAVVGGGLVTGVAEDADSQSAGAVALVVGIVLLISGIISLIEGIFSTRAAKDTSKIMPAWIFAIIGLVANAVSFISNAIQNGLGSAMSGILSVAFSVLIFVAANTIKKAEGK